MSIARLSSLRIVQLPLRNPSFGLYSLGSAISLIGMWMQRIAVGWLTWELTHSGFWLGVVASMVLMVAGLWFWHRRTSTVA